MGSTLNGKSLPVGGQLLSLTLLHSKRPKLNRVLAFLSAIGLRFDSEKGGKKMKMVEILSQKVNPFTFDIMILCWRKRYKLR